MYLRTELNSRREQIETKQTAVRPKGAGNGAEHRQRPGKTEPTEQEPDGASLTYRFGQIFFFRPVEAWMVCLALGPIMDNSTILMDMALAYCLVLGLFWVCFLYLA